MVEELFDKSDRKLDELVDEMRETKQRLAGLEQVTRQPRLAMEADVPSDIKTRERTESAAVAVQAKHGDSCSAKRVRAGPTSSTSFGNDFTGLPVVPCSRDDALVGNGAAVPKSCLSLLNIRTPTAAGGLLSAYTVSTTTRTTFYQPPLRFCSTEGTNLRTSNQYATNYSSFWKMKVLQTNSMQTLMFDAGGFKGRLRACPFLGTWRALLCGEVLVLSGWWRSAAFFGRCMTRSHHLEGEVQVNRLRRTYCGIAVPAAMERGA